MLKYLIPAVLLQWSMSPLAAQKFQPVIGVHGGINFSSPRILGTQEMITLLNGEELPEREYNQLFQNFGHQLGFSIFVTLNDYLSVGLLPQMARYRYGYNTSLEFFDTGGTLISTTETESVQHLNYINIPLVFQYKMRKAAFSPYLFGGASYGILRDARPDVVTATTGALLVESSFTNSSTGEFITSKISILGGVGGSYNLTNVIIALDVSYWIGIHNIVNESGRYANQTVSGSTYDIPDDMKLDHLVLNLSILFPINKVKKLGALDCSPIKKKRR